MKMLHEMIMTNTHKDLLEIVRKEGNNHGWFREIQNELFSIFVPNDLLPDALVPCFVSHTDTVSENKPKVLDVKDNIMSNPDGILGADDRAGCAILTHMMKNKVQGVYIFTDRADAVAKAYDFKNISCFIGLDRRGGNDVATYGYDNKELIGIFEDDGFKEEYGTYSDVVTLSQDTGIACVNLSVGYYNEHTKNEYLYLTEWCSIREYMMSLPLALYGKLYEVEECGIRDDFKPLYCDVCNDHAPLFSDESNFKICENCKDWRR